MQKTAVPMNENTNSYCDGNKTVLELFEEIVKYDNPEVLFDFSWGKEIKAEECTLSCVTLTQCDLKIPVSIEVSDRFKLQSIERLKEISLKLPFHNKGYNLPAFNSHLKKTWEISASEISDSIQQDINLSSLVAYHLQLPMEMKITTKFARLILYNYGNSFSHNLGSCCVEGKFGTATLQVPVEGGHEGGRLNVEYERKKVAFENHGNSDKIFYITAYYNCCEEFMEPVTRGHKLILVFDLIWANAKTEIPKNFPVFLTALKVIKQVLKTWIRQNVVKSELMSPSISKNQEDSMDSSNHFISEWTLKGKILFFILKEKYEEDSLAFELLLGQDRVLAELFLNSGFLDVHLAMANSEIKNESVNKEMGEEGSVAISSFIDSNDVTRNLSFKLDWNKHFVELIQSNQEKEARSGNRKDKIELGKRNLYHGVLVIWPKYYSVPIYCRFGLPSLLIRMGHMLNSSSKWKNEARQSVKSDLRQLLSFCRAEPQRAWTTSGLGKGELTLRLLRFCIILRAREEGLDLLKLLGSNFDSHNFEGIQNDQVARAIADFVSQVSGWRDVVELIEPLLCCDRITKQLLPVMKLAKCLLRSNCVEGARMVGDSVSSFFAELDQTHAAKLKKSDVEAYMDMVISLETNPNTCCRLRIASFILFLYKLRPSKLQYRLVWDLKTQYSWYLKSMQSFQFLLDELHENLVNLSEVCSVSSPRSADNVSSALSLIPVNYKENSENLTSSSGIQSGTGSLLTSFVSPQTHSKFFLEQNEQASNNSPKSSVAISLNVPCDESINPQVLVHYNSPRKNVSIPNYPETTPCISGGGFLLERFREVFDSAVEGENSLTGGSIRSISDYLFQLRDFESVYEAILMSSAVKSHHRAVSDHSIADFDFIQKSIQEERSNKSDKSENQQGMVPDHSPWNAASKSNHPDSSSFHGKGFLLERFRELWNPSLEHGTSTTGGSIRSISDYEFQLRDFESAYAEVSGAAVSANQLPEYVMVGNALSNEWFRKPSQVEDNHSKAPAVGLVSSTSSPLSGFHSTVTARCEDDRKYLKIALENTSLDNAETSTSSCRADSITEPKIKSNSGNSNSEYSFGWLVPLSTSTSPGENTISNGINKPTPPAYRTSESPSCTVTNETDTLPKTESSTSTAFKDRSSLDINETLQKPDKFFWKGDINSKDVGKFNVRAFEVNASKFIPNLNMPSTLELIGRIKPEVIWDYINQTRRTGTRDIFVFSFIPASDSSRKVYSSFIRHMHHKERFAVVGPFSKLIKDFYLVPLIKDSPIPSALISFSRGIELFENRSSSILLGIVIPSRKREALQSLHACVPAVLSNTP